MHCKHNIRTPFTVNRGASALSQPERELRSALAAIFSFALILACCVSLSHAEAAHAATLAVGQRVEATSAVKTAAQKTSLIGAVVTVADKVYNGKAKNPAPKVVLNGVKLKKNRDYVVSYKKNVLVGTATVVVKGTGNYKGTVKAKFRIFAAKKGWQTIGKNTYYLKNKKGATVKGFKTIGGNRYYFDAATGVMAKGLTEVNGKYYFFNKKNGARVTGWKTVSDKRYYFDPSTGAAVTGEVQIKGRGYRFLADGTLYQAWRDEIGHYETQTVTVGYAVHIVGDPEIVLDNGLFLVADETDAVDEADAKKKAKTKAAKLAHELNRANNGYNNEEALEKDYASKHAEWEAACKAWEEEHKAWEEAYNAWKKAQEASGQNPGTTDSGDSSNMSGQAPSSGADSGKPEDSTEADDANASSNQQDQAEPIEPQKPAEPVKPVALKPWYTQTERTEVQQVWVVDKEAGWYFMIPDYSDGYLYHQKQGNGSNCGATAFAVSVNILLRENKYMDNVAVWKSKAFEQDSTKNLDVKGTKWLELNGLSSKIAIERVSGDIHYASEMRAQLEQGRMVIISSGSGSVWQHADGTQETNGHSSGHWIVFYHYSNGVYYANDSSKVAAKGAGAPYTEAQMQQWLDGRSSHSAQVVYLK